MGMYTQLHIGTALRKDVPDNIVSILKYMIGETEARPDLPNHPLFETERWDLMLQCDSGYFDYKTTAYLGFDEFSERWKLCVTSNFKNYDSELAKFVDWLTPYCDKYPGDCLGYEWYEECDTMTPILMPGKR